MTLLPRLTLLAAALAPLLASAGLHAEAMYFTPCADTAVPGSLCSGLNVPGSYDAQGRAVGEPDAMHVFVRKIAADVPAGKPAKGTLWLVAGGPGESGAAFYSLLPTLRRSFPGFEFLIPDHRGTGHSSRLCKVEESEQSPGGRALAGAEWSSCFAGINLMPDYAAQFSITTAARDLQALIDGEQGKNKAPVYVYGVSYGTQLVLRTLQLGPLPVKGVILDSLVPPQTDARWDLSQRSHVVNTVGMQVLAWCDADAACGERRQQRAVDGVLRCADVRHARMIDEETQLEQRARRAQLAQLAGTEARRRLRESVAGVSEELVVGPTEAEVAHYRAFREALLAAGG